MFNEDVIINLSCQLKSISDSIREVAAGHLAIKEVDAEIADNYERFVMDEVSHAQIVVLELTRLLTENG